MLDKPPFSFILVGLLLGLIGLLFYQSLTRKNSTSSNQGYNLTYRLSRIMIFLLVLIVLLVVFNNVFMVITHG